MRTIAPVVAGRSWRRLAAWLAPVVVVGAAVAVGAVVNAPASDAVPSLPQRTAAQVLTAVQTHAASTVLSGEVRETANLGFPTLPGQQSTASLSWQTFLTGSHTARVWIDGPTRQRAALLGELSEADVTHNGRDVWTYTSASNTASHTRLPAISARHDALPANATPGSVATRLLAAVRPSTVVQVDTAQRVAGRAAYTITLRPRSAGSTVRQVRIAIDATHFVPLRLQVFGAGSSPAFEIGFTSVSFAKPAASTFRFRIPQGATVSDDPMSDRHGMHMRPAHRYVPASGIGASSPRPDVLGSGWLTVLRFQNGFDALGATFDRLTTPVGTSGMRLLHTALINAVILPDGRAFVGAVVPSRLERLATTSR